MDTEVATSYCTTNKANIIYHILNYRIRNPHANMDSEVATSLPARKYGHRGGNFILHD